MGGRANDDLDILVLGLGRAPPGDERHEDALKVERDEVVVEEADFEEVAYLGELWVS